MRETRKSIADRAFHDRLEKLRSQIDSLPEQYRESLQAEADNVEQRHKRWAADLRLD